MYVMGKAEYVKSVFSGENDGSTTVVDNRLIGMRKWLARDSSLTTSRQNPFAVPRMYMPSIYPHNRGGIYSCAQCTSPKEDPC